MKLNQRKSTHIIADNKHVSVEYCFTKNDVSGQQPGRNEVWSIIKFWNPETKHHEILRVLEPQSLLDASAEEINEFLEKEIECFFKHCDEDAQHTVRQST